MTTIATIATTATTTAAITIQTHVSMTTSLVDGLLRTGYLECLPIAAARMRVARSSSAKASTRPNTSTSLRPMSIWVDLQLTLT
jgi:hypothetical protein